jgi:predicted anti-sigma-YlaC factor YlaD
LNCNRVILEISNYIDGDLDAVMKLEIEQHLQNCGECMLVINQTKLTVEIFCDSQQVELPQDVRTRLHEALQRKIRKPAS